MKLLQKILYLKFALFLRFCEPLLGWECAYVCHDLWTEKKAFTVNRGNIKQTVAIHVTFILEKYLQKYIFYQNRIIFLCVQFEPLLGWEYATSCHDLRTQKEGIYAKRQKYERSNSHTIWKLESKVQKYIFQRILSTSLAANVNFLNPC